jgi:hypothetical protein
MVISLVSAGGRRLAQLEPVPQRPGGTTAAPEDLVVGVRVVRRDQDLVLGAPS